MFEKPKHRYEHVVTPDIPKDYDAVHNDLTIGDKIEHQTFGKGVIVALNGDKATIAFQQNIGIKVLMRDHPSIKKARQFK